MDGLERCLAAIRQEELECLPTDLHNFMMCAGESGLSFQEFVLSPRAMADGQLQSWERFHHDCLLIENGTASLAEALGCRVVYRRDDPPVACGPAITSLEKIKELPLGESILESPLVKANLETVKILKKELGGQVMVMGRGDQGPFSLASQVFGMERLLVAMAEGGREEEIQELLDVCTQASILYCTALLEAGADCTSIGESTAGPDVLSPAMYREYAVPWESEVIEAIHQRGGLISLHICGNATSIAGDMVSTGADILEIDQKTDYRRFYAQAKGRTTLLGAVSPISLMVETPEQVKKETGEMLEKTGELNPKGIILGPGCALGRDTPHENIQAMLSAAAWTSRIDK